MQKHYHGKVKQIVKEVDCATNNEEELAWIETYGYTGIHLKDLDEHLSNYDIIINTIPSMVLNSQNIKYVKNETLLIDLASNPGGIDKKEAENRKIKLIHSLGLPGKVAPVSSAKFIKEIIYEIIKCYNSQTKIIQAK